jgi:hypothetical protein
MRTRLCSAMLCWCKAHGLIQTVLDLRHAPPRGRSQAGLFRLKSKIEVEGRTGTATWSYSARVPSGSPLQPFTTS